MGQLFFKYHKIMPEETPCGASSGILIAKGKLFFCHFVFLLIK